MRKSVLIGASLSALAMMAPAQANSVKYVPGELIVKLKDSANKSFFNGIESLGVELDRTIKLSSGNLFVVKFPGQKSIDGVQKLLQDNPEIEYAEPNYIYEIVKPVKEAFDVDQMIYTATNLNAEYSYTPADPKFGQLWGLQNTGSNDPSSRNGVAGADIDALKAWEITKGDRAVRIAVIDTGIDYRHPDLVNQMWTNEAELNGEPGVDDDGNGYIDDIHGYDFANNDGDPMDGHSHGTHCAGTIGAEHNDLGVAGVMADVEFVAVKFLSDSGSGSTEAAIKAIDYATQLNVDIMSNSWGGGGRSQALQEAIERANAKGIVFTAAAGNSSTDNDSRPHYPSNYEVPNVISVAASTSHDGLASFSCYGAQTVHIAAPGHNILSTVKNGGYDIYSGTSMATPHVSGAIGLLIAHEGRMNPSAVRERIMMTSDPVPALRGKTINGGRLNAYNLLTDTRPERKEPKPEDWQVVSVDLWESTHPYAENSSEERTFSFPGAKYVRLVVKKIDLEKGYDFLTVMDANGAVSDKVSGKAEGVKSMYVEGDTMKVRFTSDRSVQGWGFEIEEVEVQY